MDQLASEVPFARLVAAALKQDRFVLIDVGAAGGVAAGWRCFGEKLQGLGFDPDPAEVERLNGVEPAPGFRYVAGYVGLPADHPFAAKRRGKPRIQRNPWLRLAVERWFEIQRARDQGQPIPANPPRVLPRGDDLGQEAGEYSPVINLPEFLQAEGVATVDFLKVDVDGTDYDILQSMAGRYRQFGILGVGVEVNFFGSDSDTGNTFHNIDRFLKGEGFELFDISVRRYPMRDLPGPSRQPGIPYPATSAFGRPYQGDAFFARDICDPWQAAFAESLSGERLAKSAALFAMFGLPDCAAEVLVTFRDRLVSVLDVDRGLELLAAQAQAGNTNPLPYREYIAAFEKQSYEIGMNFQDLPRARSADSKATVRPLAPLAYDSARRIVFGGATCSGTSKLSIRTPAGRWHHAVEFPLAAAGLDPERRLRVAVSVVVRRGCVGLGILSADGRSLPEEIYVGEPDGPCLVELVTDRLSQSGSLIVRNAAADGSPSELEMEIVAARLLDDRDLHG